MTLPAVMVNRLGPHFTVTLEETMIQLETLRVFVAVAEAGGFAAAARRLRLSPPAVTRGVASLEDHLGVRLFHRTTRSVKLTEAGQRFLADGRRVLAALEEAEAAARGAHTELQGELAVTAPSLFGRMHVAPLLLEFVSRHPALTVRALFVDRVVHLMDEGFDVALRIASYARGRICWRIFLLNVFVQRPCESS